MQCRCGAPTEERQSVRTKHKAVLVYQQCVVKRCGRVAIEFLKVDGQIVKRGAQAQAEFVRLCND